MSGRPRVRIAADADGVLRRLVSGAAELAATDMPRWALVGGLAVMAHLAEAHRVTRDVDAVVDNAGRPTSALEVLVAQHGASPRPNGVRLADGTDVDVITVGAWTQDALPDDEVDRMFVLAHWWAVHTADLLDLVVVDRRRPVVLATVPVATPAGLVAAKLQSCRNRRRTPAKAATDVLDAYRLLALHDRHGGVAAALVDAPSDLAPWVARALTETLVDEGARWARRLGVVDAADLDVVGSLSAERLRALLAGA